MPANIQEEEQTPSVDGLSDQCEWNDCGVPIWMSDSDAEETQDKNLPSNPFTNDSARPEETQDENPSHSNSFTNDDARPEETQDQNSSHSNIFTNDGARPGAEETQDKNSSNSNLFTNDGARPGETQDQSHSNPFTNDGARPEETQDKNPSHTNPFTYDGARPARVTKPKNVILFGETGVGKSSIINLMADAEIATTSSNLEGCTLEATEYSFTLSGETRTPLCIFDTVGLDEPKMGVNTFIGAIEKAHRLITSLHHSGGIDLLLFCIRGGRITSTMQPNYRLFFEFLCEKKVPLAFIVTHLEGEDVMEDWWVRNEKAFREYGIQPVAHACITAAPARVTTLVGKRAESQTALQKMLHDALSFPSARYVRDIRSWFTSMVDMIWSFLMKRLPASFRRKDLSKRLQARCGLSRDEAQQVADMLARQ